MNILLFTGLPFVDRLRTGLTAALMKINPFWQPLEHVTAKQVFQRVNGDAAWMTIWKPLLDAKFGPYADQVSASWLWARLHKRTQKLGYFRGGFSHFIEVLANTIRKNGGVMKTNTPVTRIEIKEYDAILFTVPSRVAIKLINFPKNYTQQLLSIPHLWAQTLIVETDTPILEKTYWLNVNDRTVPFLAVVQHTNFIDKKYYGGHHVAYIGNYLPDNHAFLSMTKDQLLKKFLPYLNTINPRITAHMSCINSYLFTVPFAQPVQTINYSQKAPKFQTPITNVYLANLDSIYPWDRGTNYSVELGKKAAKSIISFDK